MREAGSVRVPWRWWRQAGIGHRPRLSTAHLAWESAHDLALEVEVEHTGPEEGRPHEHVQRLRLHPERELRQLVAY